MHYSLRTLSILIVWSAAICALLYQVRVESHFGQWSSQVPTGIVWVGNVALCLIAGLNIFGAAAPQRAFWIGCAVVAVPLTLAQLLDLRPPGIPANVALLIEPWILPTDASSLQRPGHLLQLEQILVYGLIPLLALAGGHYLDWRMEQRRQTPRGS